MTMTLFDALNAITLYNSPDLTQRKLGSQAAEVIFKQLRKFPRRYNMTETDHDDVQQIVLLNLLRRTSSSDIVDDPAARGYLFKAFSNAQNDAYKRQKRRQEVSISPKGSNNEMANEGLLGKLPDENTIPAHEAIELRQYIEQSSILGGKDVSPENVLDHVAAFIEQSVIPQLDRKDARISASQSLHEMHLIDQNLATFESLARENIGLQATPQALKKESNRLQQAHSRARDRIETRATYMFVSGELQKFDVELIYRLIRQLRSRAESSSS